MNTGQTVYEQLQEILSSLFDLGFRPKNVSKEIYGVAMRSFGGRHMVSFITDVENKIGILMGFNDLFSIESGIMERVERKKEEDSFLIISGKGRDRDIWYHNSEYQYMIMGSMTAEEKCNYFVNNAIIPTK